VSALAGSIVAALVTSLAGSTRAHERRSSPFLAAVVVVLGLIAVVVLAAEVFPELLREMAR
jgi:hypothetical protein